MTREEAIEVIEQDIPCEHDTDLIEALELAIQALEKESNLEKICEELATENDDLRDQLAMRDRFQKQEPCDDVVSRQAVIEIIDEEWLCNAEYEFRPLVEAIEKLPSVRPQEQTGTWKEIVKEHKCYARDDTYTTTEYHCSECGAEPLAEYASDEADYAFSNFCPNCGARMESDVI